MMKRKSKKKDNDTMGLLARLAAYHHASLSVKNSSGGICFKFKCGNETFAWSKTITDSFGGVHGDTSSLPISDPNKFLLSYMNGLIFFRTVGDEWSDDFNMFGPRMLRCSSREELDMKLTIAGF